MKVLVVFSVMAAMALASLEPAGYRPPGSSSPSTRYLPSQRYGASSSVPSSRYLPANRSPYAASSPVTRPSSMYLPANEYQSPEQTLATVSRYTDAAAPATYRESSSSALGYSASVGSPSQRYLPSSSAGSAASHSGYRYGADENSQPAKYEFHYEVKDDYGNDFGHQESRDGDDTRGVYMVLLPDGRKQIVEYEANQDGYKPRISYEEAKRNGYDAGRPQDIRSGYPQGPY